HHLLDTGCDRRFEDVERAVDHDLERTTGLFDALSDANACLMKDQVDAVHGLSHERAIPDVAFDDGDMSVRHGPREVLAASSYEVVQNPNFGWMPRHELVGDMRSDEAGASRDQD